jgi:hypothetical protein
MANYKKITETAGKEKDHDSPKVFSVERRADALPCISVSIVGVRPSSPIHNRRSGWADEQLISAIASNKLTL